MALQKTIRQDDNGTANYHRIAGFHLPDRERFMEVFVESYKDADSRTEVDGDGRPRWRPASVSCVRVQGEEFSGLFGAGNPDYPCKADLYAFLKTLPQFAGATDV